MMKSLERAVPRSLALRVFLPVCAAAALAGCNLDESAQTFISPDKFFQNDAQAAIAVNAVYAPLMGWNGYKEPAMHSVMCDDNEMTCWNWMGGGWNGQYGSQWYIQDNSVWFGDYQMIERANEVIENVATAAGMTKAGKDVSTGQALFARAYAYFDLARRYGAVPLRVEAYKPDAQMGALAASPVDAVYHQITKDLRLAATLLPTDYTNANGRGLPRAGSAWGLLAKVYLEMAGQAVANTPLAASRAAYFDSVTWAAAQMDADPSVALEPNYMDIFDVVKQNTSKEVLFAVQGATAGLNGSNMLSFFGPQGDCAQVPGCGSGFVSMREDFYNTFDKAHDKRVEPGKAIPHAWEYTNSSWGKIRVLHMDSVATLQARGLITFQHVVNNNAYQGWSEQCASFMTAHFDSLTVKDPNSGTTTTSIVGIARPIYTLKYIDPTHPGATQGAANNIVTLRYADVVLARAEAANEKGASAEAYAQVNRIRQRAGLPNMTAGLSQAQFRDSVWVERAHELYAEFHGRFDLIREGRWLTVENAPSKIADYSGTASCRPRQAYQKLQPYPAKELASNPLLKQNPGW